MPELEIRVESSAMRKALVAALNVSAEPLTVRQHVDGSLEIEQDDGAGMMIRPGDGGS